MSVSTLHGALVALISDIPNIGRVHAFERYAADKGALANLYKAEIDGAMQLRGWFVRRVKTVEERQAKKAFMDTHTWVVRGFMALSDADASELTFDALIEAVRDALRDWLTHTSASASVVLGEDQGPQVAQSGPVMFSGVLCHSVTITFNTRDFVPVA